MHTLQISGVDGEPSGGLEGMAMEALGRYHCVGFQMDEANQEF